MILLVGQVARETTDREAFQEIDYRRMYGRMAKWVTQIEATTRIPSSEPGLSHRSTAGRQGRRGSAGGHADRRSRVGVPPTGSARRAVGGRHGTLRDSSRRPTAILIFGGAAERGLRGHEAFAEATHLPSRRAYVIRSDRNRTPTSSRYRVALIRRRESINKVTSSSPSCPGWARRPPAATHVRPAGARQKMVHVHASAENSFASIRRPAITWHGPFAAIGQGEETVAAAA